MNFDNVSIPDVYLSESSDFRFFLRWIQTCLTQIDYDTVNFIDLYDPLRCPSKLLWMLGDTMGFKYDDRFNPAYNRLILLYFMSMIRHKGSKTGVMLAAEVNLAQFSVLASGQSNTILDDRLEDTSIPVNSVYVTPQVDKGYIEVVYFSTKLPLDACIEYVRPLGMYLFQYPGVRCDARTKISIDARLTNIEDIYMSLGPTHVGHYRREDYARMQKTDSDTIPDYNHKRSNVYYRNIPYEKEPDPRINPGYRAVYSLQLCNNENIVKSLLDPIFSLGFGPSSIDVVYPDDYRVPPYVDRPINQVEHPATEAWNLRLDKELEASISSDVYTNDDNRTESIIHPRPAVNPPMYRIGDAISVSDDNSEYIMDGEIVPSDQLP